MTDAYIYDHVRSPRGRGRSNGSLHEVIVPIIGCGNGFEGFEFRENRDLGRYVFERVLA